MDVLDWALVTVGSVGGVTMFVAAVIAAATGGLGLLMTGLRLRAWTDPQREQGAETAERLGLEAASRGRFTGSRHGYAFEVRSRTKSDRQGMPVARTTCVIVPLTVSPGLAVLDRRAAGGLPGSRPTEVPGVDRVALVRGGEDAVSALTEDLWPAWSAARLLGRVSVVDATLTLEVDGRVDHLEQGHIDAVCVLASAIEGAVVGPWQQAARRWDLALDKDGNRLLGDVAQRAVRVHFDPSRGRTLVELAWSLPGLEVRRRGAGDRSLQGDPIFDQALVVKGDISALAGDDEGRASLLELVHGHGATLDASGLRLDVEGRLVAGLQPLLEQIFWVADRLCSPTDAGASRVRAAQPQG